LKLKLKREGAEVVARVVMRQRLPLLTHDNADVLEGLPPLNVKVPHALCDRSVSFASALVVLSRRHPELLRHVVFAQAHHVVRPRVDLRLVATRRVMDKKSPEKNLCVGDLRAVDVENLIVTSLLGLLWGRVEKTSDVATSKRGEMRHTPRREITNSTEAMLEKTPRYFNVNRANTQDLNAQLQLSSHEDAPRQRTWNQSNWAQRPGVAEAQCQAVSTKPKLNSSTTNFN
jgi:hypothetical protein